MLILFAAALMAFALMMGALAIALARGREVHVGCASVAAVMNGACPVCGAAERAGCARRESAE